LTHTFLLSVTAGIGHGVYRKLYTLIGGQRAEKFENHCCSRCQAKFLTSAKFLTRNFWPIIVCQLFCFSE